MAFLHSRGQLAVQKNDLKTLNIARIPSKGVFTPTNYCDCVDDCDCTEEFNRNSSAFMLLFKVIVVPIHYGTHKRIAIVHAIAIVQVKIIAGVNGA